MRDVSEMQKVRARDVVPYEWAVWCTVDGYPKAFANSIEHVSWSEDGQHLWFMLGTHNFYKALPDEEIELVPCGPSTMSADYQAKVRKEHAETIAKRPTPKADCPLCDGTCHTKGPAR
jgi:hypothetical protein